MIFKRKLSREELLIKNSELITSCAERIGNLIADNEEITSKLSELRIFIRYFSPSLKEATLKLDAKIDNLIGDIKIALSKASISHNYSYASELISKLSELVSQRRNLQ